jgi:aminomethyltransferase
MVEFADYDVPRNFEGIIEEHLHCRSNCSIFDLSYMGQIRIHGKDRQDFIESLVVSDIKELKIGSSAYTVMTNEAGGIIDDTVVTNLNDFVNVVVNASCLGKDFKHLNNELETNWKGKDVSMELLQNSALISIQGPKAYKALQPITAANLNNLHYMESVFIEIPYINETVLVSRGGFTGR